MVGTISLVVAKILFRVAVNNGVRVTGLHRAVVFPNVHFGERKGGIWRVATDLLAVVVVRRLTGGQLESMSMMMMMIPAEKTQAGMWLVRRSTQVKKHNYYSTLIYVPALIQGVPVVTRENSVGSGTGKHGCGGYCCCCVIAVILFCCAAWHFMTKRGQGTMTDFEIW